MFCAPGQYFGRYRGCQVLLSCFALADSFWAVPRAPVAVFMFCAPDTFLAVPRASSPVFMFCAPGLFLGVTEGFRSRFHVLRSRTHYGRYRFQVLRYLTRFRQYRGRRGPFSGFALPNSFLTLPRPSRLDLRFCATGLFLGVSEGAGFRFHVLCSRASFGRYQGCEVTFSSFSLPDSFSTVPKASGLVFMFCAPGLGSGGTVGVGYHFQVLCSRTRFQRYRGHRGSFSCFEILRVYGLVVIFCAPGLFLDVIEGVGSRFHVLSSRNHFGRYRGRRVPFSCFVLPDSFSTVARTLGPIGIFCAP
jgi:hypothetical protein